MYVPDYKVNLLSVNKITNKEYEIYNKKDKAIIKNKDDQPIFTAKKRKAAFNTSDSLAASENKQQVSDSDNTNDNNKEIMQRLYVIYTLSLFRCLIFVY